MVKIIAVKMIIMKNDADGDNDNGGGNDVDDDGNKKEGNEEW